MDTISNIAGAASNAIWGQPKTTEEPVSGKQGAGTVEEPFDKGNEESTTATGTSASAGPERNLAPKSGVDTATNRDGPSESTSATVDPKSGQNTQVKHQGAANPGDAPKEQDTKTAVPHTDEEREALMMKGEFPHDPNDHSGEPLKMHGGAEKKEDTPQNTTSAKTDRSKSVAQEGGNEMGKKLGTGEQYVKSSGLVSEGGDFDATKPGAGAEATRLLEENGVHKATPDKTSEASSSSLVGSEKTKTSKMAKIKEKLHIKH